MALLGRLQAFLGRALLVCLLIVANAQVHAQRQINIALVKDGQQAQLQNVETAFREELLALTTGEFDVIFHEVTADWTISSVDQAFNQAYSDSGIEMVLVVGFAANQLAVSRAAFPKPTFLPLVFNPELLGAPVDQDRSGQKNLNYLADRVPLQEDLASFQRVSPFTRAYILTDALILEAIPDALATIQAEAPGIEFSTLGHDGRDHALLEQLPSDIEAVILGGLPRMPESDFVSLLDGLARRGIPGFSLIGSDDVRRGALAADSVQRDIRRLARRNALNMQAVLLGESAAVQPVYYEGKRQLTINMDTARRIGLSPRFDVLSEAELINPEPQPQGPEFDLVTIARAALAGNLDLGAARMSLEIGEQDVRLARAGFLPQIDLGANYVSRDDSLTVQSGALSERSADSVITMSMPIYSESVASGYQQQVLLQQAQKANLSATELDTVFDATTAYLEALRVANRLKIQQENLKLTKANLELAEDRVRVGSASNADVYRWESNLAQARADLLTTLAARQQALESINRLLHRPLDEPLRLKTAQVTDPFIMTETAFRELVNNSRRFAWFTDFHIARGLKKAPELTQLQAQIDAAQRDVVAQQRSFWLPAFSVRSQYTDNLNSSGLGSGGPADGASDWNVSINASVPLFSGGSRQARLSRSKLAMHRLVVQKEALAERIEQDIRANIHATQARYTSIELSGVSARAASKNLALVTDAYRQGTLSIIDLLDAQNQSLQADLNANNSVYDFLLDVVRVQRATGQFDFLLSGPEKARLRQEIQLYIDAQEHAFAQQESRP